MFFFVIVIIKEKVYFTIFLILIGGNMRDQIFILRGEIPPYCLKNKHVIAARVKYLTLKLHRKNKKKSFGFYIHL